MDRVHALETRPMKREIVEIATPSGRLVGTFHRPVNAPERPLGLLLFNSGFLPRAPVGDLTVHLCDRFAAQGIASFRFDMPGLGDSDGRLQADVETFFSTVLGGAHGDPGALVVDELLKRFGLSGLILGGLCGGAVTSVYAAQRRDQNPGVRGIIMLDPSFKLITSVADAPAPAAGAAGAAPKPAPTPKKPSLYAELRVKTLSTPAGQGLRKVYHVFKPGVVRTRKLWLRVRGNPLPQDANRKLLGAIKKTSDLGIPVFIIMAGEEAAKTEKYDYKQFILRHTKGNVSYKYLPGTTHSFVEGDGEKLVTDEISQLIQQVARPSRETAAATQLAEARA